MKIMRVSTLLGESLGIMEPLPYPIYRHVNGLRVRAREVEDGWEIAVIEDGEVVWRLVHRDLFMETYELDERRDA